MNEHQQSKMQTYSILQCSDEDKQLIEKIKLEIVAQKVAKSYSTNHLTDKSINVFID